MAGRPRKLTPEAIARIRRWYEQRLAILTAVEMAKREGVAVSTLMSAAQGLTHKTVRQ